MQNQLRYRAVGSDQLFANNSLKYLSEEELQKFDKNKIEVEFRAGEIIYKQGAPLTHLVIIYSGFAKIYIESPNEKNLILKYTRANDINGGLGIFMDQKHHSSMMAVTDCKACFLDVDLFYDAFKSNCSFMEHFLKEYSERISHDYKKIVLLTQKNMEARIAESILYLNDRYFLNGSIQYIPKRDLADYTAMTKESAIRVLKQFKDEGLIELNHQTINILDKAALQQIALHG